MNKLIPLLLILFGLHYVFGQQTILPGDKSINKSLLKSTSYTMEYSTIQNGILVNLGNYKMQINYNNQTLEVNTVLSFNNNTETWKDYIVADGTSFRPISIDSKRSDRNLNLNYSNEITGLLENHENHKKILIKEKAKGLFFDIAIYPYILPTLPLTDGYKAIIPVYDYEAVPAESRYSNVKITGVYSDFFSSSFSGVHKIWRVEVFEESTKQNYQYYIDQKTQKFWEIRLQTKKGDLVYLKNNEIDFNPLKNKFDKEATLKLITEGKSTLKGQAFARDNRNGGGFQGKAVLNVNKKQFAPKGTVIVLVPYTNYFKEWNKRNETYFKEGLAPQPLEVGAVECMVQTTVIDDEGHFEFANLMDGDYLVSTSFIYSHDATLTTVVGQTDYFIDGNYQGSTAITNSENYVADVKAKIRTIVTIKKNGEILNMKLKKTF